MEWSQNEIDILKDISLSNRDAADRSNRSFAAVKAKRQSLGITKTKKDIITWTKSEIKFLRSNLHLSDQKLAAKLNKTASAIGNKRQRMKYFKPSNEWDEEELDYLMENYRQKPNHEISKFLGRSVSAIQTMAYDLGLTNRTDFWKQNEIDLLMENWDKPLDQLATMLNKSTSQISYKRAYVNYLRKKSIEVDMSVINKSKSFLVLKEQYFGLMQAMQSGESFDFPIKDYAVVMELKKLFTENKFKTKKLEDKMTRRIVKLI